MCLPPFLCVKHKKTLSINASRDGLQCSNGCFVPIVSGVPKFIDKINYAARFGLQWNRFRKTQLDSYTGTTISRDRLTRMAGGSLNWLKNKTVLEAGCGAGRFTEILLSFEANVTAFDLSDAVTANRLNHQNNERLRLLQADLHALPFEEECFDVVICIGVVQHTPNPEQTIARLTSYVKPGGVLIFDHYPHEYAVTPSRRILRKMILALPNGYSIPICKILHLFLWPIHRILWRQRSARWGSIMRQILLRFSPMVDYHDSYPQIGSKLLSEWAFLDTHDTLSDYYKHLRSVDEIIKTLKSLNLTQIRVVPGGTAWKLGQENQTIITSDSSNLTRQNHVRHLRCCCLRSTTL